jgi:predicted DNA-binding transcriptional regulator YafY
VDRTERFYRIRRRLVEKGALTRREIEEDLEISHATFKRDLEYLRDRLNVPVVWSRERQAYVLDPAAEQSELPGVWFSPAEVYALLEIDHLLDTLGSGLLARQLAPLRARLAALLESGDRGHREIRRRIRVLTLGTRRVNRDVFESLSLALLGRRRVFIRHLRRGDGDVTERTVSPQRLVHYRYNWYLDAWDHGKEALRTFAVDAILHARVEQAAAKDIPDAELDRVLGAGYGIFAGAETQTAVLRFTPESARWVADEVWHSK